VHRDRDDDGRPMNLGIASRRVGSAVFLVAILVVVSGLLELASVVRLATERAATECDLVTHTVRRQLDFIAAERPSATLAELGSDPRLWTVLTDAIAHAPSALHVAVCDTAGVAVAHSLASGAGKPLERYAPLPRARNLADSFRVLWQLREPRSLYESYAPLARDDEPFASIRVIVPRAFLWDSVNAFFWRGVVVATALVSLAIGAGVVLSRLAIGRIRVLEAGVAAIREGRFDGSLPETGANEFSRLTRELNLLGREYREERQRLGAGQAVSRAAELLGAGVVVLDASGAVVLVNAAACRWLGVARDASRGKRLDEILPAGHPLLALAARLREPDARTLSVPLAESSALDVSDALIAVGHRVADPDGSTAGILIETKPARDVAARNALADQTRVLSRLGEMATGVAHELRDPLQTLSFDLDAVARAARHDPDEIDAHVRSASEKIRRLDRAISGFLKIARLRPTAATAIDANALLREAHASLEADANLAGLDLDLDLAAAEQTIIADAQVLQQAVYNLVRNAIVAQPSREKRIVLRTRREAARDGGGGEGGDGGGRAVGVDVPAPRAWVCIDIADSGPGIPRELRERVLDLFFTTRPEGTGVGLSLARQAAELHGGEILIDSEVGVGTRVTLRLPAADSPAVSPSGGDRIAGSRA